MSDFNFTLLYVDNPERSAAFYADLLDLVPVEASPTFAMFVMKSGSRLGLWSRHHVKPAAVVTGGGGELVCALDNENAVRARHADWVNRGLEIAQAPTELDFGLTFVALDPDGHRLRIYSPLAS
ncbi:VOC family protein [Microvirga flavescens]|uniref:VOC family protein n=1 Tax=Microvirga flavescens TaxID=2249811 RepID=UPI000DDA170A|nr:VOC family protein [Microvirga flavescens]